CGTWQVVLRSVADPVVINVKLNAPDDHHLSILLDAVPGRGFLLCTGRAESALRQMRPELASGTAG
ncbi:MAG: hypothetical protein Q8J92_00795, partial [Parvibaculum sp.]|nr:hypothetical protein [Parvibaculum sp.]